MAAGFRELVLTGIHLGHYGVDFNRGRSKHEWRRLSHLLKRLMEIPDHPAGGPFRVRLSSIEATEVTRELLNAMAAHPRRICPHLHVSMQSGSDGVLARMRRRWGVRRFVDRCRLAQATLDLPALTTDIIVGFPGETDAEFDETCRVVEELGFSKIHIFPFSPRRGTPAADMPGQVSPEVKADRVRRLRDLETRTRRRYYQRLVGRRLDVLVQSRAATPGNIWGTACRYAAVELPGTMKWESDIVPTIIRSTDGDRVFGEPARPF
jgi:threonylcarbamoyladenosine tRNA methylthiotransferase MtaB